MVIANQMISSFKMAVYFISTCILRMRTGRLLLWSSPVGDLLGRVLFMTVVKSRDIQKMPLL